MRGDSVSSHTWKCGLLLPKARRATSCPSPQHSERGSHVSIFPSSHALDQKKSTLCHPTGSGPSGCPLCTSPHLTPPWLPCPHMAIWATGEHGWSWTPQWHSGELGSSWLAPGFATWLLGLKARSLLALVFLLVALRRQSTHHIAFINPRAPHRRPGRQEGPSLAFYTYLCSKVSAKCPLTLCGTANLVTNKGKEKKMCNSVAAGLDEKRKSMFLAKRAHFDTLQRFWNSPALIQIYFKTNIFKY